MTEKLHTATIDCSTDPAAVKAVHLYSETQTHKIPQPKWSKVADRATDECPNCKTGEHVENGKQSFNEDHDCMQWEMQCWKCYTYWMALGKST